MSATTRILCGARIEDLRVLRLVQESKAPGAAFFFLSVMTLLPGAASSQGVGDPYWGLSGGAQFYQDNRTGSQDVKFDPGFAVAGQLGYIFGSVRAEGEIEYNNANVGRLDGANVKSDLSVFRGTGSLYFDFVGFDQSNILPYVGGGFGLAALDFDGDINDDELALTAHGEGGVSFASSQNFDFVVSYRFEWFDSSVGNLADGPTAHQIRAGIRFFR